MAIILEEARPRFLVVLLEKKYLLAGLLPQSIYPPAHGFV
jgi:hypothetical protein